MPLNALSSRTRVATLALALALALGAPGRAAEGAAPGPEAPRAGGLLAPLPLATTLTPRALLASPLVTIERIDGGAWRAGPGGGAPGAGDPQGLPGYLLDPDALTTFGQVLPPDGGGLILLVE